MAQVSALFIEGIHGISGLGYDDQRSVVFQQYNILAVGVAVSVFGGNIDRKDASQEIGFNRGKIEGEHSCLRVETDNPASELFVALTKTATFISNSCDC